MRVRSRLVAATTRTSTRRVRVLPSRSNSCSCKHAQELGLEFQRDVADFVQKERSVVGQLEAAKFLRDGAGEGAALVAEQLGFEQAGGDCGAIDFDEGAIAARAEIMDGARDEFLARAGFAANQHGGIGGSDGLAPAAAAP